MDIEEGQTASAGNCNWPSSTWCQSLPAGTPCPYILSDAIHLPSLTDSMVQNWRRNVCEPGAVQSEQ
eukprot:2776051-Amphidinium_carterae.1